MGPAVGWVEEGSQTLLWVLNCGFNGIDKRTTHTAVPREPRLLRPPWGWGQPWSPSSGHGCLWGGMARIWSLAEVTRAWKSFWDAERWHEAGELLNGLCKVRWSPNWTRSWLGIWENAVMEGMETLQNFSPAALAILSLKPAFSTGKSCAESPAGHSQTFLGQALVGPLHPWDTK